MKKLSINILLMLFLINSEIIYSQVTQEWTSRYGQSGIDGANAIATDNFGNVYVTGSEGDPPSTVDLVTIKYSSSGLQTWLARYNGPGNGRDGANSIKLDSKGNVVVAGKSEGNGTNFDYITIKYSSLGEQKWIRRYTSPGNQYDEVSSIVIDSSDNIYITGLSNENYVTIKYDSLGNQKWVNSYGTENNLDISFAIAVDNFGNIYITGQTASTSTGSVDIATIMYDTLGIMKWVSIYNSSTNENDYGLAIGVDVDGNVFVCGGSQGNLHYDDYVTVKYDSSGIEQWNRRYNGSDNFLDQARSLVIDNSDNVYITGYSTHAGTGYDFTTIKYNNIGDQLWLARYHNGFNDMANKITIDENGNLYVTGQSDGNGTGFDYATVKYDSSGNQLWVKRYDYSGDYGDLSIAIAIDEYGSVYVTGESNRDFLTIKYSQLTGGITNLLEISLGYKLSQNYPNPFNPSTIINYQLSMFSNVSLNVYDLLGNEVKALVNKKQNAGSYEVEFDGEGLPSGIYFYSLSIDGNVIDTKRMILLK